LLLDYVKKRIQSDEKIRAAYRLRSRLKKAFMSQGTKKSARTQELIGCSLIELWDRIESLFQPGMNWSNYGTKGWHLDHIRPLASFDLTCPEQQKAACHYTNLQPLWALDNIRKNRRWSGL